MPALNIEKGACENSRGLTGRSIVIFDLLIQS